MCASPYHFDGAVSTEIIFITVSIFRHCETPARGVVAISLRGMQKAMICLLSMEEITSSAAPPRNDSGAMRETASLCYTPLAVTTSSVIARPPEGVVAISCVVCKKP
ncbi:MAG: hypothetical protein J7L73_00050 [Anaerolineales bacterium]|nr:hypothetical protein [Anaerolineales bacterium]